MNNKLLAVPVVLLAVLGSCTKKVSPVPVEEPEEAVPVIAIHEPAKDHYASGTSIPVSVTITDSKEMHEARCWMITQPQQDTLWSQRKHVHSKSILLEHSFQPPALPEDQRVALVIWAENSDGVTAVSTHSFEIH